MGVSHLKLYKHSYSYSKYDHKEYKRLIGSIISNFKKGRDEDYAISSYYYSETNGMAYCVDFNILERKYTDANLPDGISIHYSTYSTGKDRGGLLIGCKILKLLPFKLGLFDKSKIESLD